jgi:hypothetical protein
MQQSGYGHKLCRPGSTRNRCSEVRTQKKTAAGLLVCFELQEIDLLAIDFLAN